ncbi:MAG: hypothetical protein MAG795_00797 [Candidatus Woesearchaeota archaeon]|nr:hypothetical protein [Candidatus Woesearchaeota archaeon]
MEKCAIYQTADIIGKKWTLLILMELYKGKKRYNEIEEKIPKITPKMLSLRLSELIKKDMVNKKVDSSTVPIKCEYSLTKSGEEFINILKQIKTWAINWKKTNNLCQSTNCKECKL